MCQVRLPCAEKYSRDPDVLGMILPVCKPVFVLREKCGDRELSSWHLQRIV